MTHFLKLGSFSFEEILSSDSLFVLCFRARFPPFMLLSNSAAILAFLALSSSSFFAASSASLARLAANNLAHLSSQGTETAFLCTYTQGNSFLMRLQSHFS